MSFLGQTEERFNFARVRLLVLIKDENYVGWENLMALKVITLYFKQDVVSYGSQCNF